jgi:hypothetical protein
VFEVHYHHEWKNFEMLPFVLLGVAGGYIYRYRYRYTRTHAYKHTNVHTHTHTHTHTNDSK